MAYSDFPRGLVSAKEGKLRDDVDGIDAIEAVDAQCEPGRADDVVLAGSIILRT
jgi:hypothetical protein